MVVVLGGGVGGLSAAYYLLKSGTSKSKVTLLEASSQLGGWIRSVRDEKTGALLEMGPRTIRPAGPQGLNTLSLIQDINLSDKVRPIKFDHPAAKNRFIYVNQALHLLPMNIKSFFRRTPPFSRALIFSFVKDLFAPVKKCSDDSLYAFVERRLGKDLADYAVSSMVCGICAGDAKEISVRFLLPDLFKAEQEHGSIVMGMYKTRFFADKRKQADAHESNLSHRAKQERWSVWMLDGGLQTLTDTLTSNIKEKGAEIQMNAPCQRITFNKEGGVTCEIGEERVHTDHVISSLPACALAPLLEVEHAPLARELAQIEFVTVGVVNLVYSGRVLKKDGFGLLIPPCEQLPVLGIIFDSCCHVTGDACEQTVLTVMVGGRWYDKYFGSANKEALLETALQQVGKILDIRATPLATNVSILDKCIPQYVVGHYDRVERIFKYVAEKRLPLSLAGSSFHGVGLNDVILASKNAVDQIQHVNT